MDELNRAQNDFRYLIKKRRPIEKARQSRQAKTRAASRWRATPSRSERTTMRVRIYSLLTLERRQAGARCNKRQGGLRPNEIEKITSWIQVTF